MTFACPTDHMVPEQLLGARMSRLAKCEGHRAKLPPDMSRPEPPRKWPRHAILKWLGTRWMSADDLVRISGGARTKKAFATTCNRLCGDGLVERRFHHQSYEVSEADGRQFGGVRIIQYRLVTS